MIYLPIVNGTYLAVANPIVEERAISDTMLVPLNASLRAGYGEDGAFSTSTLINALWGDSDGDRMERIFQCESHMRQWEADGTVKLSETADLGIAQINEVWWGSARSMGYDLDKTYDNILMAKHVWDIQGFKAWTCAKKVGVI